MDEKDVYRLLMARRDNYEVTAVEKIRGRRYTVRMKGKDYNAVVLFSSFQYYKLRYHVLKDAPDLVICYSHDTALSVPCLSFERGNLAEPYDLPSGFVILNKDRKSKTGSQILTGMLICGMRNALDLIHNDDFPHTTRKRYLDKVKMLNKRTRGRPVGEKKE